MKRSSVRAFGIAIFLVGALYTLIDQFHINLDTIGIKNDSQPVDARKLTELESQLKKANEKNASLEARLKKNKTVSNSDTQQTQTSDTTNTKSRSDGDVTYTLEIYRNMSIYSISEKLEDAGIIDNALELELYLAKEQYVHNLQIGSFELHSNMTTKEIADMITKKTSDN